ncbi:MAG: XRE family transcriptional regulator [Beggiatoa sp. IS2]|nr:MAG: XRE family transcriptional regulator [Beggiatoa sp. IS2]
MPKSKQELLRRDATRNLGEELLQSVREMKADQKNRITQVSVSWINEVRLKTGLSQNAFAELLGVSVRTLQDWEQGRREPSGAARTLLKIAEKHPNILAEVTT